MLKDLSARLLIVLLCILSFGAASSDTPVADAAKQQDIAAVRALLQQQVDANTPQADGATALHWAAHWNDLEMVNLLLGAGARVNAANDYGVTPLSLACTNRNAAMVEALLQAGANPNAALLTGETPLMTAAYTGNLEVVKTLLAHGADVHAKEPLQEQTALMLAVSESHLEIARALIEDGADVRARSKGGFTPLLFAARQGDLAAARLLVAAGANVNDVAADGRSALVVATVRGHAAFAAFLLDQGAEPNADGAGYTALHWAAGSWETELTGPRGIVTDRDDEWRALRGVQSGKLDLVKALLARGANPNAQIVKPPPRVGFTRFRLTLLTGATPFLLAAMAGDASVMRVLTAGGADPRLATKENTTPLMAAAGIGRYLAESLVTESGALDAVKLALDLGGDANAANEAGDTALHAAASLRLNSVIQVLVENGARVNVKNKRGQTPLMIAEGTTTGDLLRKLGAETNAGLQPPQ